MAMKYVPIYCEEKRRRDVERWTPEKIAERRPGRQYAVGKTFAALDENGWHCSCCKKPVKVVW